MRVLHLTLTAKWFDKILSGKKKFEFREAKLYWIKRLAGKGYDIIEFKNGYSKDARTMIAEYKGVQHRRMKGISFFAIRVGDILETKNLIKP